MTDTFTYEMPTIDKMRLLLERGDLGEAMILLQRYRMHWGEDPDGLEALCREMDIDVPEWEDK